MYYPGFLTSLYYDKTIDELLQLMITIFSHLLLYLCAQVIISTPLTKLFEGSKYTPVHTQYDWIKKSN